jgi:hypothetical protein
MFTLKQIAIALNGKISGEWVVAPALGHSPKDDSLHVRPDAAMHYGFRSRVHFAGASETDQINNREYVREKLGVPKTNGKARDPRSSGNYIATMLRSSVAALPPKGKIVATYDYRDRDGTLLYEKLRFEPKRFVYRLPDGSHKGPPEDRRVVYRWSDLLKYPSATVFVCEGEKDADRVASLDLCATTAASGKWTESCLAALTERDCWIIQDCDQPGKKKAVELAELLLPLAASVKIVHLPGLTGEKNNKDVSDWLDQGHTKEELERVCADTPDWVRSYDELPNSGEVQAEAEPPAETISLPATISKTGVPVSAINAALLQTKQTAKPKPTLLGYRRHRDTNNPTPKYLIKNLLPETGIGLLSGQSGTYKSFVAIKLAGAVGMGQPFAGHAIKRQGAVLIFATEGAGELPVRLDALSKAEHDDHELPIYHCDAGVRLLDTGGVASVIATAKAVADEAQRDHKLPLVLILFDTIIAAAQFAKAGDENDAAVGQKLMAALGEISRATGAFVLGVDHFGKAVETGTRGSSAKEAAADVVLALLAEKASSGEVTAPRLCIRKRRGGPAGVEYPLTVKTVRLGEDEDGEAISSLVIDFSAAISPPTDDAGKWTPSLRLLRKVLMTLLATAGEKIQPYADGPEVLAVKADYVRAEFFKQHAADQPDSKRKAFDRAVTGAQGKELIGLREVSGTKWLWLAMPT